MLELLFAESDDLALWQLTKQTIRAKTFRDELNKIKKELYDTIDKQTALFDQPLGREKKYGPIIYAIIFIGFTIFLKLAEPLLKTLEQYHLLPATVLTTSLVLSSLIIIRWYKVEAKLSPAGLIAKEHLLGFKMFLYHAERYRLQNLTPQTFEQYLPYAMIFAIEKQWADNLRLLNINTGSPVWCGSYNSTNLNSFSLYSFSHSFSSAITGTLTTGTGGGHGVGGGFAGGGGGGGGGGAR